jgi:hypothetical protein
MLANLPSTRAAKLHYHLRLRALRYAEVGNPSMNPESAQMWSAPVEPS